MKINSINLNAYQAMNSSRPITNSIQKPVQQAAPKVQIKGANFINQLSEQEINFLSNNFKRTEAAATTNNRQAFTNFKHKIDILA